MNEEYYRVKCVATNPTETSTSEGVAVPATSPHPSVDLAKPEFIRDITRLEVKVYFDRFCRCSIAYCRCYMVYCRV